MIRRLLLPALGLALAAAAAAAPPARRPAAAAEDRGAAAARATPRLATWREAARPPAEVPPTAIVRAARRDRVPAPGQRRSAERAARREPVEIVWDAPNSMR